MKVVIIGASDKTGIELVRESLKRGCQVVAVCRHSSSEKLNEFTDRDGFTVMTAPVVSDEATLRKALGDCEAVVRVLIAVRRLKATELVASLAKAAAANGVKRLVFTADDVAHAVLRYGHAEGIGDGQSAVRVGVDDSACPHVAREAAGRVQVL